MPELTFLLDGKTGSVLLASPERLPPGSREIVRDLLGPATPLGCARPPLVLPPPVDRPSPGPDAPGVRVSGYYHNSLVEGPGRRSCALFTGCDLGCPGCWVPYLHRSEAGAVTSVDHLAAALLDPAYERDGISLLGGEPFQQPEGLWALIQALRKRGGAHILCYSGYTYEQLRRLATRMAAIHAILETIDILVDGPYVAALAPQAGPWTGSENQRVIDLKATRRLGQVVRLDEPETVRTEPPQGSMERRVTS